MFLIIRLLPFVNVGKCVCRTCVSSLFSLYPYHVTSYVTFFAEFTKQVKYTLFGQIRERKDFANNYLVDNYHRPHLPFQFDIKIKKVM